MCALTSPQRRLIRSYRDFISLNYERGLIELVSITVGMCKRRCA